jgi:hypothetical protein
MLALPLAGLATTGLNAPAAPLKPRWKVVERSDVGQVPSAFPVGFSLLTHGSRQYAAFYDAAHQMTVATRELGGTTWQTHKLPTKVGWDSHNYVTMAMDSAGDLHLSGNMHCVPLIYFRTEQAGDITSLKRLPMTGREESRCTYPNFFRDAGGRLLFQYRDGGSGNGSQLYNVYDATTKTWSRLLQTPLFDGEGQRNAYVHGPVAGPDRFFHVVWVWRETPDCATNHDLSYARSRDLIHWETAAGVAVKLPLKLTTPGLIVDPVPVGGGIINGCQKLVFDAKHRPLIAYHKNDADGNMQLYAARFEDGKWNRQVLTTWQQPVKFSGGGTMPFIGISLAAPQPFGDKGWTLRYRHRDYGSGLLGFRDDTLRPVKTTPALNRPEYPAEVHRSEIAFDQIGVQQAGDLGDSGDPKVRYVMVWETLPSNHDRPRAAPLPPPATLRVFKLVRDD